MPDLELSIQDVAAQATVNVIVSLPGILAILNDPSWVKQISSLIELEPDPSSSSILANSFWLLSLLISLTCALIAMLIQQWARRHAKVTPPRSTIPEQARMRAYFAAGIERSTFTLVLQALSFLMHISLFLFFAGFLLFVLKLGQTVFVIACSWTLIFVVAYTFITFMPIFRPDSPFYTPLSDPAVCAYAGALWVVVYILWSATLFTQVSKATREYLHQLKTHYCNLFLFGTVELAEEKARELSPEIDGDVLKRTFDALRGDDDIEQFFEGVLGFCDSELVKDPQHSLKILGRKRLAETLEGFWDRTLSLQLVSEAERGRRIATCLKVINAVCLSPQDLRGVLRSVEIGHSVRNVADGNLAPLARCLVSGIISNAERNDPWFTLAMDELGVSEDVLRSYLAHGDSVPLAVLIHFIRQVLHPLLRGDSDLAGQSLRILPSVSKFDILNTFPELRHEFCALWNEIIRQVRKGGAHHGLFDQILVEIQHLYVALHPVDAMPEDHIAFTAGCDDIPLQSASYPLCETAGHHSHSDSISDIHDTASGITRVGGDLTTSIATSLTLPGPDVVPTTVTPHVSSFPSSDPHHSSRVSLPGHVPDTDISQPATTGASPCYTISPQSQRPPTAPDIVVTQCIADISHESSVTETGAIPQSLSPSDSGSSLEPHENERTAVGSMASEEPNPMIGFGSNHVIRRPGFLSPASTNALSHPNPQAAAISGAHVITGMATVGAHDSVQHLDVAIRIELRLRRGALEPSLPDVVTNT